MAFIVNRTPSRSDILVRPGIIRALMYRKSRVQAKIPSCAFHDLLGIHFHHKRREVKPRNSWMGLISALNLLWIDVVDQIAEVLFDRTPPEFHASGQSTI